MSPDREDIKTLVALFDLLANIEKETSEDV
jgi:hypothetical protein